MKELIEAYYGQEIDGFKTLNIKAMGSRLIQVIFPMNDIRFLIMNHKQEINFESPCYEDCLANFENYLW